MKKDRYCNYCKETFNDSEGKVFSNHVKWCNGNPNSPINNIIKCDTCNETFTKIAFTKHSCNLNKKCKVCEVNFTTKNKNNLFCSKKCSATFNNKKRIESGYIPKNKGKKIKKELITCDTCFETFEYPINQKAQTKCKICRNISKMLPCNCVICNSITFYKKGNNLRKTCSTECYRKLLSINASNNKNCGGETNYRKYRYNNILMDSKWELEIAKLLDFLNIKWVRNKKICLWWVDETNNKRRYHPDFYLPDFDVYLEPKNKYLMEKDSFKIKKVLENNKIKLIIGDVKIIKEYINSISNNVGIV